MYLTYKRKAAARLMNSGISYSQPITQSPHGRPEIELSAMARDSSRRPFNNNSSRPRMNRYGVYEEDGDPSLPKYEEDDAGLLKYEEVLREDLRMQQGERAGPGEGHENNSSDVIISFPDPAMTHDQVVPQRNLDTERRT